jgi:hypothetical protein
MLLMGQIRNLREKGCTQSFFSMKNLKEEPTWISFSCGFIVFLVEP